MRERQTKSQETMSEDKQRKQENLIDNNNKQKSRYIVYKEKRKNIQERPKTKTVQGEEVLEHRKLIRECKGRPKHE